MVPIFPKFQEIQEDNVLTLKSNIHIHKDSFSYVKIYTYEVESVFILEKAKDKELLREAHLRECFRLSKYIDLLKIDTSELPLVATLDKSSEDFLHTLYYQYP